MQLRNLLFNLLLTITVIGGASLTSHAQIGIVFGGHFNQGKFAYHSQTGIAADVTIESQKDNSNWVFGYSLGMNLNSISNPTKYTLVNNYGPTLDQQGIRVKKFNSFPFGLLVNYKFEGRRFRPFIGAKPFAAIHATDIDAISDQSIQGSELGVGSEGYVGFDYYLSPSIDLRLQTGYRIETQPDIGPIQAIFIKAGIAIK